VPVMQISRKEFVKSLVHVTPTIVAIEPVITSQNELPIRMPGE
jgi:hypothetical protein